MTSSHKIPNNVQVDFGTLKNGKVTIYVHWDVEEVTSTDPMTNMTYINYTYSEACMEWILPQPYETPEEIQAYFDANYDTGEYILGWAQATRITLV